MLENNDMNSVNEKWISMEHRVQTISLMIIAAATVGLVLYWLRPVLLPFVLALFFTVGLTPIFDWFQATLRVSRLTAVAITFICGLIMTVLLWLVLWLSIASLLEDSSTYNKRFSEIAATLTQWLPDDNEEEATKKTTEPQKPANPTPQIDAANPATESAASELLSDAEILEQEVHHDPAKTPRANKMAKYTGQYLNHAMGQLYNSLSHLLGMTVMVSIFMFFLLLGNTSQNVHQHPAWREIEEKIRNYIVTKTVISFFTGVIFGVVLWFYGIPLAVVFALLAFLLNFIPNVGPLISIVLPIPMIFFDPNLSIFSMAFALIIISVIHFISGNIIETKIMGDSFELHPIAILITLMFWGMLWGLPGMFLAVPLTAAAKILLEKFELTHPLSDLLEGKWPTQVAKTTD